MRRLSIVLGLAAIAITASAGCLRQADAPEPRGHEETPLPTAKPQPAPDPTASGVPDSGACRSLLDRVKSLVKAAPDAAIYRELAGAEAADYVARFNRDHRMALRADALAVVRSPKLWGDRAIVLFARDGCDAGMVEIRDSVPG